ncbi:hypothetical protein [Streptomyces sp. NPDC058861]
MAAYEEFTASGAKDEEFTASGAKDEEFTASGAKTTGKKDITG